MNDAVLPYLRCPNCSSPVSADGPRVVTCTRGHRFDVARQGYLTLTAGRAPHAGDSAGMVADREAFLAAGHYGFVAGPLAGAVPDTAGLILDAGTGTGYYLARVLTDRPYALGLGLDVSKPALRRAARAHPRAAAVLADLWRPLPVADGSAAVILNVFAPRNGPEFHRVLAADGVLVVVTPAEDHLAELIDAYGLIRVDPDKADRVRASLGDRFIRSGMVSVRNELRLTAEEVETLIGMTPSARHVPSPDLLAKPGLSARTVTAAVDVTTWRPV
jgi:23S rRNA (guanine745-N1)-methyltransferase